MISRSLPHGWKVYVKEHFITFSPLGWGWKKRSSEYYERIHNLPNVVLIPIEIPTAQLIDGSKAVGTVTGSIGIEAVARSKPVLTFGSAWYNGCEGVFPIQNHSDCKEVLASIERGVVVDPAQMLLFIQASESVGAEVNFPYSMRGTGDRRIAREDTIKNMVVCISRWWNSSCKNNHV
jgi:capsule polysaccharide modification protein KpsS